MTPNVINQMTLSREPLLAPPESAEIWLLPSVSPDVSLHVSLLRESFTTPLIWTFKGFNPIMRSEVDL